MIKKFIAFIGVGFLIILFAFLAFWQWSRYQEKIYYLKNPPSILKMQGQFIPEKQIILQGRTDGQGSIGYDIVQLWRGDDNNFYPVHLGFVANNSNFTVPFEATQLEYLTQKPYKAFFQPNNDIGKNLFYYIDIGQLQVLWGVKLQNIILYSQLSADSLPKPRGIQITNNHLGYFLTWLVLCIISISLLGFMVFHYFYRHHHNRNEDK